MKCEISHGTSSLHVFQVQDGSLARMAEKSTVRFLGEENPVCLESILLSGLLYFLS